MTTSGRPAGVAPRTRLGATGVSLDPGPLVSPYARDDARHVAVVTWMKRFQGESHTVEPVLAQAAYFLPLRGRAVIADLAASGRLLLHHPDASADGYRVGRLRAGAIRDEHNAYRNRRRARRA